jgi:hypothetical protein
MRNSKRVTIPCVRRGCNSQSPPAVARAPRFCWRCRPFAACNRYEHCHCGRHRIVRAFRLEFDQVFNVFEACAACRQGACRRAADAVAQLPNSI